MRKLLFTLSSINAVLNMLVIGIFMQPEVFVLYGFNGKALATGSRWFYLIWTAIPLIISGTLLIAENMKKKNNSVQNDNADEDDDLANPLDEIFGEISLGSGNWGLVATWFFAIISWVLTGIALNNIQDIGVILPSIIVIMLSAVMIFLSSFYREVAPNSVGGIRLPWLAKDTPLRDKTSRVCSYLGVMGGLAGVCLSAWSIVISNNLPNCVAIGILLVFSYIMPIIYSYITHKSDSD
ncbi:MAG: hypothetical protein K2M82_03605 [Lachnospiraceae bacterium]|nr:hypothetical protein [Lachnospiraceae bacterium]